MCLFFEIDYINKQYRRYAKEYSGRALDAAMNFFCSTVSFGNVWRSSLWAEVWATYAVFDPSYANKQSFGFYVDVGNGFTTLAPTFLFLVGMTKPIMPARILGILGLLSFYQELYGTVIYFFSYIVNKRYKNFKAYEIVLFVCFTNGLWFFLPLLGMYVSYILVQTGSFDCIRCTGAIGM